MLCAHAVKALQRCVVCRAQDTGAWQAVWWVKSSHMTVGGELVDLEELRRSPPQSGLSVWLMNSLHQMLERLNVPKYSPVVNQPRTCDSETVGILIELDPE